MKKIDEKLIVKSFFILWIDVFVFKFLSNYTINEFS